MTERPAVRDGGGTGRGTTDAAQALLAAGSARDEPVAVALDRLTRLVVRDLADWAVVDLVHPDGVRRESAAHHDPDLAAVVRLFRVHSPVPGPVRDVLRTGRSVRLDGAPLSAVTGPGPDHGQGGLARELGHGDVLLVPLRAGERVVGVLSLVSATAGRFGPGDLELAEELGRRAGAALAGPPAQEQGTGADPPPG